MEITKKEWNMRATACEHTEFLQSYEWGEFQHALGRTVVREYEKEFFFSAVRMEFPFGFSYWYIPRGLVLTQKNISAWVAAVRSMAQGAVFLRFEPICSGGEEKEVFQELEELFGKRWVRQTKDIQPKTVWIVDVSKSTDQLLSDMHSKTRYNIRLAQRKGVTVSCTETKEDRIRACETFLTLAKKTSHRREFRLHPDEYYRTMVRSMEGGEVQLSIYTAQIGGKNIAAALIIRFGDTATYIHGGSDGVYRENMAPHFLHWKIMEEMKKKGIHWYDMGGIDGSGDPHHPWAGITRFKQGFDGSMREYSGTFDLIFRLSLYTLYKWFRAIRRGW
ncbi:peptidoglycan bridge formation glycyltransferase FemA/FemB family protein [Candidatus Uhrbacteria bacterium]|nr:peptidoglycan bridge formation glycyltransferase FemA/FemB family protein [Candidatus Uhrbacteria bacterium]